MTYAWHTYENGRQIYRKVDTSPPPARSPNLACPMIITDTMAPVQSMLDGKLYDSKAALRATYKAAGVVEVGNDSSRLKPRERVKPDRKEIARSLDKAASDFNNGKRASR